MDADTRLKTEEKIIAMLKTVYDPEIPVNIYDLGLIYKIDLQDDGEVVLDMTLTAPNCPAAALCFILSRKFTKRRSCVRPCAMAREPKCASERKYTFFIILLN